MNGGPERKRCSAVGVSGDESKVRCCEEQNHRGNWNIRSMNQGTLEVVKQEMAKVNIDILEISKLKWTGCVTLTQMMIIYTIVGKNPLEEME